MQPLVVSQIPLLQVATSQPDDNYTVGALIEIERMEEKKNV